MKAPRIRIIENPEGYSEGTYGYEVHGEFRDGTTWVSQDGGYATPENAREKAELVAEAHTNES